MIKMVKNCKTFESVELLLSFIGGRRNVEIYRFLFEFDLIFVAYRFVDFNRLCLYTLKKIMNGD
jgi:hypothetical protein